ncbi:D-alanine aminotransferase [Alicyclobacillus cellulosilyticus]|uniref:D-alanine aminotransferase n=1 Tax=Alicyclobacillus cellulosilyticus TaxID=1003997 RepID=A0A917NGB0_9BACL|nr:aminotransferase class IV [Alicyclobacillus cellulosilyticus]GGI98145.1 D-alanine aminotransferase [Alicyclobacillus cellulosilyticus]
MPSVAYVNGVFVAADADGAVVPLEDRGHLFGDGVYEVVRVYGGRPFLLAWHLERLAHSLAAIGLANPHSDAEWTSLIEQAVAQSGAAEATVYWQVTRGTAPRAHTFPDVQPAVTMVVRPWTAPPAPRAATLLCLPDERWANAWVKSINLLPNVIAKENARRAGADEALLVRSGAITEGAASNLFVVHQGVLYTHPANRYILAGITRRFVLGLAHDLGIPVREVAWPLAELAAADEVFLTGTTTEVLAVDRILAYEADLPSLHQLGEERPRGLVGRDGPLVTLWQAKGPGPVTGRLQEAFAARRTMG